MALGISFNGKLALGPLVGDHARLAAGAMLPWRGKDKTQRKSTAVVDTGM